MTIRITRKVRRVIDAIHSLDQAWGLAICQATGFGPGTVYPILDRLHAVGWIVRRVEGQAAPGRPPRTIYHLTMRGQLAAGITPAGSTFAERAHSLIDALDDSGDGPSVREAAADDRAHWNTKYAGEDA